MKQVERGTWFCLIFTILLTAGLGIFLMRYTTDGADWAAFRANKHIYNQRAVADERYHSGSKRKHSL